MSFELEHAAYHDPRPETMRRIGRMCAAGILRAVMDYSDWGLEAVQAKRELEKYEIDDPHGELRGWHRKRVRRFKRLREWFESTSKRPGSFEWMAWAAWPEGAQGRIERCREFLLSGDFRQLGGRYRTIHLVTRIFGKQ